MFLGRPPFFDTTMADCDFPYDSYASTDSEGVRVESGKLEFPCISSITLKAVNTVRHWRYRWVKACEYRICDIVCNAKSSKYCDVVELDKSMREFGPHTLSCSVAILSTGSRRQVRPPETCILWYLPSGWSKVCRLLYLVQCLY